MMDCMNRTLIITIFCQVTRVARYSCVDKFLVECSCACQGKSDSTLAVAQWMNDEIEFQMQFFEFLSNFQLPTSKFQTSKVQTSYLEKKNFWILQFVKLIRTDAEKAVLDLGTRTHAARGTTQIQSNLNFLRQSGLRFIKLEDSQSSNFHTE